MGDTAGDVAQQLQHQGTRGAALATESPDPAVQLHPVNPSAATGCTDPSQNPALVLPCREQLAQALLQSSELILPELCLGLCLLQGPGVPSPCKWRTTCCWLSINLLWQGVALRARLLVNHPLQLSSLSEKCKVYRRSPAARRSKNQTSRLLVCLFLSASSEKKESLEQRLFSTCPARVPWLAAAWLRVEAACPKAGRRTEPCCSQSGGI